MSRIQLSQPSFANGYARSRGESVAPELYPLSAYVPVFGYDSIIRDFGNAKNNATITNTSGSSGFTPEGYYNQSGDTVIATNSINALTSTSLTVFSLSRPSTLSGYNTIAAQWNSGTTGRRWKLILSNNGDAKPYFDVARLSDGASDIYRLSSTAISTTKFWSVCGVYTKSRLDIYVDGILCNGTQTGTIPDSLYGSGNPVEICNVGTLTNHRFQGHFKLVYIYPTALSCNQVAKLHQDPLLPFRRRLPVFYSVPSAGGGTDNLTATGITTGAPVLGTPAIGQAHALTASAITTGAPVLGTPAVGQAHALSATGITASAPSLGAPAIGQVHTLAAGAITAGSPSVGAPAIGQVHALSAAGIATEAPTLGTPELSSAAHSLTADSITTGAPDLGAPAIGQTHALTAGSITTGAPFIAAPAIGQVHALSAVAITTEAPVLGTPAIGLAAHDLAATAITTGAPTLGTPIIGQVHILTASGITARAPTLGTPSLDWAITDTPACRTTIIPYEDRTTTIPYETGRPSSHRR